MNDINPGDATPAQLDSFMEDLINLRDESLSHRDALRLAVRLHQSRLVKSSITSAFPAPSPTATDLTIIALQTAIQGAKLNLDSVQQELHAAKADMRSWKEIAKRQAVELSQARQEVAHQTNRADGLQSACAINELTIETIKGMRDVANTALRLTYGRVECGVPVLRPIQLGEYAIIASAYLAAVEAKPN